MSTTIDERIVKMDFDDSGFEAGANEAISILTKLEDALKLDGASAGLDGVKRSMENFNASPVVQGIEQIKNAFNATNVFVAGMVLDWARKFNDFAINAAKKLYKGITAPVTDGFKEYEQQMKAVQTISANSGESLDVIQANLDELNEYADKTVYVFSDMTSAIGRFTAAGIGVEDSTKAIQGFFNAAALSGADAQAASRGVYQLSQAMSAGVVRLQDWKSIENASIDTESFRRIIMLTAEQMGVTNDKFKQARDGSMSFRESLSGNWLTVDVMQKALENLTMSTMDFEDAEKGAEELLKELTSQGYGEKQAKEIIDIATAADQSAREIRTWSQLIGTIQESMGSGWANTWKLIVGDYKQSAEFFTWLFNKFDGIVSASSNARNQLLSDWQESGGRNALIGIVANSIEAISRIVEPIVHALGEVFKITGEQLAILTENLAYFTEDLVIGGDEMNFINSLFFDLFTILRSGIGVIGNGVRVLGSLLSGFFTLAKPFAEVIAKAFAKVIGWIAEFSLNVHLISDELEEAFSGVISNFVAPIEYIVRYAIGYLTDLREAFLWALPQTELGKALISLKNRVVDFLSSLGLIDKFKNVASKLTSPLALIADLLEKAGTNGRLDKFKQFFLDTSSAIEKRFSPAVGLVKSGFIGISTLIKPVIEAFKTLYGWVSSFSISNFSGISGFVSSGLSSVVTAVSNFKFPSFDEIATSIFGSANDISSFITERFLGESGFGGIFDLSAWRAIENAGLDSEKFRNILISTAESMGITGEGFERLVNGSISFRESLSEGWLTSEVMQSALEQLSSEATNASSSFANFARTLASNVREKVVDLKDRFLELITNADLSTESIKNFVIQLGAKVKTKGGNAITTVVTTLTSVFSKLLEYIKSFKGRNLSIGEIVSKVFSDVYNALKRWLDSISSKSEGFKSVLAGLASTIIDKIAGIPSFLSSLFGDAKAATDEGIQNLTDSASEFQENASNFWTNLLDKLPSLSDIGAKISEFVSTIKRSFLGEVDSELDGSVLQKASVFDGFFNLSQFNWVLPDWKTPVENFIADFASVLDMVPDDRINALIERFAGWAKTLGTLGFAFSGWKFLGSLTRINNARAAQMGALGDFLEEWKNAPSNLGSAFAGFGKEFAHGVFEPLKAGMGTIATAITNFGKAFDPLGKKSKGRQFQQVALGILALAGALFVISKIPADDLERSGQALLKIGAASAIIMLVIGVFTALGKINFEGVGAAFAGLGVGLLSLSAALYILCNLLANPDINIEDAYSRLMQLMAALTLAVAVLGLTTKNSAMAGAAASLIALSLAITLSLVPLSILSLMSDMFFLDGIYKLSLLGSFIAIAAMIVAGTANAGSAAGALVLLALVTALTLAILPLVILSQVPEQMYQDGLRKMRNIGIVLVILAAAIGSIGLLGPGVLLGIPAILALIVALSLAIIPVTILGKMGQEVVDNGAIALLKIGGVLSLLAIIIALVGTFLPGIILGSAGLILMIAAVGLLAALVSALSIVAALNPEAFDRSVYALFGLAIALGILAVALAAAGPAILLATGALIGMVAAVGIMAALVAALAYLMDLHPEAMIKGVAALAVIVAIMAGIGIAGAVSGAGMVILAAGIIAMSVALLALAGSISIIRSVFDFGFFDNLFSSFSSAGQNVGAGLSMGIDASGPIVMDAITRLASGLWQSFCEWLGINSPSTVMEDAGEDVVQGLVNGIIGGEGEAFDASQLLGEGSINGLLEGFGLHMGEVENTGSEGASSFLDQFSDLPAQLGEKASAALQEFLSNIDTEELSQKGADLIAGLLAGIANGLAEKMQGAASEVFHSFVDPICSFFDMNSPSKVMEDMGGNVVTGFANGLGHLEELRTRASELGNTVLTFLGDLPGNLLSLGQTALSSFGIGLSKDEGRLGGYAKNASSSVTKGFDGLGGSLKLKASTAMTSFGSAISGGISTVKNNISSVVTTASNAIAPIVNKLKSVGSSAVSSLANAISSGKNLVSNAVARVVSSAAGSIGGTNLSSSYYNTGRYAVEGLANGINNNISKATNAAKNLARAVTLAASVTLKVKSPSRVFREIGDYVGQGFVLGIHDREADAYSAGEDLANTIPSAFSDSLSKMSYGIEDMLSTDYNPVITPVINSAEFDYNLQQLSSLLNNRLSDSLNVNSVNYNETFAGKLDAVADINRQAMQQFAENAIDYDRLGVSVANALIRSGVHVEMDGGQLMGYLAGEIRDVRRMYG